MNGQPGVPQGTPYRQAAEDAAYSPSRRANNAPLINSSFLGSLIPRWAPTGSWPDATSELPPRDNSSRFDD